jgi:hypothetical protein
MDQLLWLTNQKHWAAVRSHSVHSFLQRAPRCLLGHLPATADCASMLHQNHFGICHVMCIFWRFFIYFYCAGSHNGHRWERETCQPYKGKPGCLSSWWREGWQVFSVCLTGTHSFTKMIWVQNQVFYYYFEIEVY